MFRIAPLLAALLLSGCATQYFVFGQAYYSECSGQMVYRESVEEAVEGEDAVPAGGSEWTCEGTFTELAGGSISSRAAGLVLGIVAGAREAVLTAFGAPGG